MSGNHPRWGNFPPLNVPLHHETDGYGPAILWWALSSNWIARSTVRLSRLITSFARKMRYWLTYFWTLCFMKPPHLLFFSTPILLPPSTKLVFSTVVSPFFPPALSWQRTGQRPPNPGNKGLRCRWQTFTFAPPLAFPPAFLSLCEE